MGSWNSVDCNMILESPPTKAVAVRPDHCGWGGCVSAACVWSSHHYADCRCTREISPSKA